MSARSFNPCSLNKHEQIPAKIWELLCRNTEFEKAVKRLRKLDTKARETNRSGPEWKQSCDLIDELNMLHPLAALALKWLVPEPEFFIHCKRHGRIQDGEGYSPDLQNPSWVWRNRYDGRTRKPAVQVGGVHLVRGPSCAASNITTPFPDWQNWKPGEAMFDLSTTWNRLPKSFRNMFVRKWREIYDSPNGCEFNYIAPPRKTDILNRDDLAEYLAFVETVKSCRLFAVSPAMLTTKDVKTVFSKLQDKVKKGLPPNREHIFGSKQAWHHHIARVDRGLSLSKYLLGSGGERQSSAEDTLKIRDQRKNVEAGVEAIQKLIFLVYPVFDLKHAILVHSAPPRKRRRKPKDNAP
jgi:hypothetical protein